LGFASVVAGREPRPVVAGHDAPGASAHLDVMLEMIVEVKWAGHCAGVI
jgi:hypothetical protein